MIHTIQNDTQALANLLEQRGRLLIFDLDGHLDPTKIPCVLHECETCDATMHFNFGEDTHEVCPRCGERSVVVARVELAVQGAFVLCNYWRQP